MRKTEPGASTSSPNDSPRILPPYLHRVAPFIVLLGVCLYASSGLVLAAQTLTVSPDHVLADQPATIRVAGLQPHEHISIQAHLFDGKAQPWASQAEFAADDTGTVDTSTQAPVDGSYRAVSAMGLIWSMKPAAKGVQSYSTPSGVEIVHFELMRNGTQISTADLERTFYPAGLQEINLTGELHGLLVLPEGFGPHPGVLVVGGSEGGTPRRPAIWLASHGYAALALAYFGVPGLPQQLVNIPLEYFGQAIGWMKQRPEIAANQLAVMGGSRGGELALQLGALYPALHAVVAYVPANVRFPSCCSHATASAWTWQGRPLSYDVASPSADNPADSATIHVELTNGPILMISGGDDGVWRSREMADAAMQRLQLAHFRYPFQHLSYPHAGHRAGEPWIIPTWSSGPKHTLSGESLYLGGTPEGNALSTLDADPKVLAFLQESLSNGTTGGTDQVQAVAPH
jgi:dienelactone hydrolase